MNFTVKLELMLMWVRNLCVVQRKHCKYGIKLRLLVKLFFSVVCKGTKESHSSDFASVFKCFTTAASTLCSSSAGVSGVTRPLGDEQSPIVGLHFSPKQTKNEDSFCLHRPSYYFIYNVKEYW